MARPGALRADPAPPDEPEGRDSVGDLNADAVKRGDFPGSIQIPGPKKISLAIGGFIKTIAIFDSRAESAGVNQPAVALGSRAPDRDGGASIDATLTRLNIDARATPGTRKLRGYIEWDFNAPNDGTLGVRVRHAFASWETEFGTLTLGHTWSTLMDLKILPESLAEPTTSGVIFQRQPIVRWSVPTTIGVTIDAAVEDPDRSDVAAADPAPGRTSVPDAVLGVEYGYRGVGHVRVNGLVRRLATRGPGARTDVALGGGATLTAHLELFTADRLMTSLVYGQGLGRYLLGIPASAGSSFDPKFGELSARRNDGAMVAYLHQWTDTLRSTGLVGVSRVRPLGGLATDQFERSTYASINLMRSIRPFFAVGAEYVFTQRRVESGAERENHRVLVGMQIY